MLFMVALILLGLVFGWRFGSGLSGDGLLGRYFPKALFSAFGALIGFGFGLLLALFIGLFLPSEYVFHKQTELVAIQDTSGIQGRFFLGSGTFESRSYYVFYQKYGDGIIFGRVPVEKAVLYEEERNNGLIKEYLKMNKERWYYLFGVPGEQRRYDIIIPNGSILHDFRLDLE